MILTIGEPGDPEMNPTILWPKTRKEVNAGTLTITSATPSAEAGSYKINYDPLVMADGIAPTDDLFCYFALRPTPRPTPDGCATCDRDSNERGVIWNGLYRESPEATASSCDQGLDAKEILTEDEVKCSLLISPFYRTGNPSLPHAH